MRIGLQGVSQADCAFARRIERFIQEQNSTDIVNKVRRDPPILVAKLQRCIDRAVHEKIGSVRQILAFDNRIFG